MLGMGGGLGHGPISNGPLKALPLTEAQRKKMAQQERLARQVSGK